MRLPRDVSGRGRASALRAFDYEVTRQTGSHLRVTRAEDAKLKMPQHHVTIPNHDALRIGTLAALLDDVAGHLGISRDGLLSALFRS